MADHHSDNLGQFRYRHSGVIVASEIELPEWQGFLCHLDDPADVIIRLGEGGVKVTQSAAHGVFEGGRLNFAIEGIGVWSVRGGQEIVVYPEQDAGIAEIRLFTLGSAWGALGYQRGWAMLHGGAVTLDGKTVLFCGDAEAGKSTMTAAMINRGAQLVADDLSRVEPPSEDQADSDVRIFSSSHKIKLWDDAINKFGWDESNFQRDFFRDNKFHVPIDRFDHQCASRSLSAIFILAWDDRIQCDLLRGAAAVRALTEGTMYRKEFLELMGRLGEQVVHCMRIAGDVPIYRLSRPKNFVQLDAVCDLVEHVMLNVRKK